MSLSFKQLALYITLLAVGGGAGWLGGRYFPVESGRVEGEIALPVVLPPGTGRTFPSGGVAGGKISNDRNFIAVAVEKLDRRWCELMRRVKWLIKCQKFLIIPVSPVLWFRETYSRRSH
jgi:hypothetical protein